MAVKRLRLYVATIAANFILCFFGSTALHAEPSASGRQRRFGDGPNLVSESDVAAGRLIDSFFEPDLPGKTLSPSNRRRHARSRASRRPALRAKLVHNPDTSDGSPPFALVDRYGGVLRSIEPVDNIDLDPYLGEMVAVRRDTGDILLASQLVLPGSNRADGNNGLQLVDFQESIPPGEIVEESLIAPDGGEPIFLDEGYDNGFQGDIDFGGYPRGSNRAYRRRGGRASSAQGVIYARAEYLLWWFDGMSIPPLVVRGDDDGDGNFTNAEVVYGNQDILDDSRDGARIRLGLWLDDDGRWALQGDYFGFSSISSQFVDGGDGVTPPFVGRPFIDATTGLDAVEDVSFPGIQGTVAVDATSEFHSAGLSLRYNLCSVAGCTSGCGDCVSCGAGIGCGDGVGGWGGFGSIAGRATRRVDVLFGVRYARLQETLNITEDLQTTGSSTPITNIDVFDHFGTENEFLGGELGFLTEWEYRRWSLELLSKLAIGNTRQRVHISGSTTQDDGTGPVSKVGGLLTQTTNIGSYSRNEFSVLPEIGLTLGYQLTRRLRLTAGYTLLYWSRVARPGDQIDLEVNPSLLTFPPNPAPNPARPRFDFRDSDLWAQGLNIGGEYRW